MPHWTVSMTSERLMPVQFSLLNNSGNVQDTMTGTLRVRGVGLGFSNVMFLGVTGMSLWMNDPEMRSIIQGGALFQSSVFHGLNFWSPESILFVPGMDPHFFKGEAANHKNTKINVPDKSLNRNLKNVIKGVPQKFADGSSTETLKPKQLFLTLDESGKNMDVKVEVEDGRVIDLKDLKPVGICHRVYNAIVPNNLWKSK